MATPTYTKGGTKSTAATKLNKQIFGVEVKNHQLLKDAYLNYLAAGRLNLAKTKSRGEVRGGGRKPWRQKGTGRARFGSSRNPIWTGGGVAFGPTGIENYVKKLSQNAKRQAVRQALSLAATEDRIKIIESFASTDGKVKAILNLLSKLDTGGQVLVVTEDKDSMTVRATNNLKNLKLVQASYLNAFDILNADTLVISRKSLDILDKWLAVPVKRSHTDKDSK
ncbi:MAG: 50S ribosomal protein L4 [Candidatus Saccharimonadales bacterium]